jgi:hypothetical protein
MVSGFFENMDGHIQHWDMNAAGCEDPLSWRLLPDFMQKKEKVSDDSLPSRFSFPDLMRSAVNIC